MTTGSHHMQTYWVSAKPGNLLFSFPFTYVREADRWVPSDETFLRPPGPPQIELWNNVCIKCHCVGGQPGLDRPTQSLNTSVAELGISCEACHGPGEEHVRRNLNPSRRYGYRLGGEPDPTIVNPVHLDSRRSAEVCGQCHAASAPRDPSSWYRTGYPYRAGDELAKTRIIVRHPVNAEMPELDRLLKEAPTFLEDRFWPDGMIRLSGREYNGLIESPCYQRGELNCLSCHASHASDPDDQLAAKMNTDEACFQCHSDFRDRVEAHTHHPPDSSGSHCYNCHMPHTTYGLLKAERSHEIDSPTVAASVQTGRPNACNLCHLDRTLAWAAEHLTEWYGTPPIELSDEQQSISAAILWILKGDAGQRALLAWHMEWAPALDASGRDWLAPFLAPLLDDPYTAVRYIAQRALRRLPRYADFDYDFLGSSDQRKRASQRALEVWRGQGPRSLDRAGPHLLIDPPARLREAAFRKLLEQRDDRRVDLRE